MLRRRSLPLALALTALVVVLPALTTARSAIDAPQPTLPVCQFDHLEVAYVRITGDRMCGPLELREAPLIFQVGNLDSSLYVTNDGGVTHLEFSAACVSQPCEVGGRVCTQGDPACGGSPIDASCGPQQFLREIHSQGGFDCQMPSTQSLDFSCGPGSFLREYHTDSGATCDSPNGGGISASCPSQSFLREIRQDGSSNCDSLLNSANDWSGPNVFGQNVVAQAIGAKPGQGFFLGNPPGDGSGGPMNIHAGDGGVAQGGGGDINLWAGGNMPQGGSGYGNLGPAGRVGILGGSGYNSQGGDVSILSGSTSPWAQDNGAHSQIYLSGGSVNPGTQHQGDGASMQIEGGHAVGYVVDQNGTASARGGDLRLHGGEGVGDQAGGNVLIWAGNGAPRGHVGINTDAPVATLDVNGAIKLGSDFGPDATNCNASTRGMMQYGFANGTNADALFVCMKAADGSYSWKTIASG